MHRFGFKKSFSQLEKSSSATDVGLEFAIEDDDVVGQEKRRWDETRTWTTELSHRIQKYCRSTSSNIEDGKVCRDSRAYTYTNRRTHSTLYMQTCTHIACIWDLCMHVHAYIGSIDVDLRLHAHNLLTNVTPIKQRISSTMNGLCSKILMHDSDCPLVELLERTRDFQLNYEELRARMTTKIETDAAKVIGSLSLFMISSSPLPLTSLRCYGYPHVKILVIIHNHPIPQQIS